MSVLRNENGKALWYGLAILAAIGILFFQMWHRARQASKRAEQIAVQMEADLIMDSLRAQLQNPETCLALLKDARLSPGESRQVALHHEFPSELMNGIRVTGMGVELEPAPNMDTQIDIGGTLTPFVRFGARLKGEFEAYELDKSGNPRKGTGIAIVRTRPFLAWVDGSGELKSCFGLQSAGSICNDLGGYFFSELPEGESYDQSCRQSLFTRRLDKDGGVTPIGTCRLAKGGPKPDSCKKLYGSDKWKAFRYQDAHKDFVPEVSQAAYMCMRCQ
jgi:hypothetical protein